MILCVLLSETKGICMKEFQEKAGRGVAHSSRREGMHWFYNKREAYYTHPYAVWPALAKLFYNIVCLITYVLTKLLFRWTVDGSHTFLSSVRKSSDTHKGAIIVCNHVSVFEPVILLAYSWLHRLHIRPLYKDELNKGRLTAWFFAHMGCIPVHRDETDLILFRRCQRLISKGDTLLIFPEGTRVNKGKAPVPFHRGFALIALTAQCNVYPCAVVGAIQIAQHKVFIPHKVRFKFGKILNVSAYLDLPKKQRSESLTRDAQHVVFTLRDEMRSTYKGLL